LLLLFHIVWLLAAQLFIVVVWFIVWLAGLTGLAGLEVAGINAIHYNFMLLQYIYYEYYCCTFILYPIYDWYFYNTNTGMMN
jgi:hypothetical protein